MKESGKEDERIMEQKQKEAAESCMRLIRTHNNAVHRFFLAEGLHPGQAVSVYIKNILPDKMKIKLVVVNKNLAQPLRFEPHYFVTRGRIKKWTYSTPQSRKQIETVF